MTDPTDNVANDLDDARPTRADEPRTDEQTAEQPGTDADEPGTGRRRGRRPGAPDTRAEILTAARSLFLLEGYAGTSMRGVARAAGVDPALVHHYFGDKGELFRAMIQLEFDPAGIAAEALAGGKESLGPRVVATVLQAWESDYGQAMIALIRQQPDAIKSLAGFISSEVMIGMASTLGIAPREAAMRASLIEVQMVGMLAGRYIAQMEPLASLPAEELVRHIGGVIQHFVVGDLSPRPRRKA